MTNMKHSEVSSEEGLTLVDPIPENMPLPALSGSSATAIQYFYRDAESRLRLIVLRREWTDEKGDQQKNFCPHTLWTKPDGEPVWRRKSLPSDISAPFYRREELALRPTAPVLVVEGEKCADAAAACFPDYVVVSILGGSSRVTSADFGVLAGRDVIVVGDADEPGQKAVDAVKVGLREVAPKRLRILDIEKLGRAVTGEVGVGYDIADAIADGLTSDRLNDLVTETPDMLVDAPSGEEPENEVLADLYRRFGTVGMLPPDFEISTDGVIKHVIDGRGNPKIVPVCSPIALLGYTETGPEGDGAGAFVAVENRRGNWVTLIIPWALLAGDGREVREMVAKVGGVVAMDRPGRTAFAELLGHSIAPDIISIVNQPGWTQEWQFLTPTVSAAPPSADQRVLLDLEGRSTDFGTGGTLDDWKTAAKHAENNHAITFGLMIAFVGPLAGILGLAAPGYHLYGKSSLGKTSILSLAASAWGPPSRWIKSWSATTNGIEGVAADRNDTLLTVDELHLSDPSETANAVYIIGNGTGKQRAEKTGKARSSATWSTPVLSAGEGSFGAHMSAAKSRKLTGGLAVRMADIAVDPERGTGINDLHGHPSTRHLVDAFAASAKLNYGHAGPAFVKRLVADLDSCRTFARQEISRFIKEAATESDDPQILRAAEKFGMVAAAGRLAVQFGLLPWSEDKPTEAAGVCFQSWVQDRGSAHRSQDEINALNVLQTFFDSHGPSRFLEIKYSNDESAPPTTIDHLALRDRCGYRTYDPIDGAPIYFVLHSAWKSQVCAGHDPILAARAAAACGALHRGEDNHLQQKKRLPDYPGGTRVYVIRPDMLA